VRTLSDLLADEGDGDAVAITFDDGFTSFDELAWPRLREAGLPATLYVVTGRVGEDNRWGGRPEPGIPDLPLMDWEALGRVAGEGVELGGHGRAHLRLDQAGDAEVEDEIEGCREEIRKRTGSAPSSFAYPYGAYDDRAEAAAVRTYENAVTTELRPLRGRDPAHRLPRLDAFYLRRPGRLERFGSGGFRRYVAVRAALRGVRGLLRRKSSGSTGGGG